MTGEGIDYTHEAFKNADNTTRIAALWDQTQDKGEPPEDFPYGTLYDRAVLNQALAQENPYEIVDSRDENGHGTFLAGAAAGNENRAAQFSGVAPLAELVIVKCREAKRVYRDYYGIPSEVPAFQENDIMAGISFIMQIAEKENKPVVICIGMGTNMGSHNGAGNLSAFMDRYTAVTGIAMLCAAGNEGNARHHHHIVEREETINVEVSEDISGFMAQLWWRTPGTLTIDLISPSGEVVSGIRAVSGGRRKHRFTPESTEIEVYFGVSQTLTREQVVVFRFVAPRSGIWKIRTRFDYEYPNFHMWLPIRQFLEDEVVFLETDPDVTICNPGTGRNLLTVSAYDVADDSLYLQAGRGFTPLGVVKPEIVAPGVNVTGVYPAGRYRTMSGTGTAAAFAAGVSALFMQQYRAEGISGIGIREVFIRGAVPRGEPFPNTEWGFGIVNAYASLTEY